MFMFNLIKTIWWQFIKTPYSYAKHVGVKMGKGCYISTRNFPTEASFIELGDNVRIAKGTSFYTHGGIWSLRKIYNDKKLDYFGKIKVGDNTYIGEDCKIMPGVTIGRECIIGAGTVLSKSVPDGCMVAGNPCKFIGYTDDYYKRIKKKSVESGNMSYVEKMVFLKSLPDADFVVKDFIRIPEDKIRR